MKSKHAILPFAALAVSVAAQAQETSAKRPNFVIIMTDQQRADLTAREGYPLDLTPFADSIANHGAWFDKAYTPAPASGPARVSILTGRFPSVTHADSNHNIPDAVYSNDLFGVAKENGYLTAMVGKNHTYMKKEDADFWCPYNHLGQEGKNVVKTEENKAFDQFLGTTSFYASFEPSPGTVQQQIPYRMVTDALKWVDENKENPFVMLLSFPEPHNPYQVCEPYFSMFKDVTPPAATGPEALKVKGEKFVQLNEMMKIGHEGYDENLEQIRTIYMGMIRMLDDQMARFVKGMQDMGVYDNTVFVITSDHGDYAGEYGLMKKGASVSDAIARVPMVWFGNDIAASGKRDDHISLIDIFPTMCETIGAEIPLGVQGRSLKEMLSGRDYPEAEFQSIKCETGFGGQYYTKEDDSDYRKEGAVTRQRYFFDELNTWSQSGTINMVRMGDWKLVFDMAGKGELYNIKRDPSEMKNLYGVRKYADIQNQMMAELIKWQISTVDQIPVPRNRYYYKRYKHNYMFHE